MFYGKMREEKDELISSEEQEPNYKQQEEEVQQKEDIISTTKTTARSNDQPMRKRGRPKKDKTNPSRQIDYIEDINTITCATNENVSQTQDYKQDEIQNTKSYSDIAYQTELLHKGALSNKAFYMAQIIDHYINDLKKNKNNGILHFQQKDTCKPILPTALAVILVTITTQESTSPQHKSKEILMRFTTFRKKEILQQEIQKVIANCHICQVYNNSKEPQQISTLVRHAQTRLSWSIDLITDMTQTYL